jgi:hypothetical protein
VELTGRCWAQWNVYDFVDDAQPLPHVRQQDSPVFVVGHERDKGGMLGVDAPTKLRYLPSVTWDTMLSTAADDDQWLYWTGLLEVCICMCVHAPASMRLSRECAGQINIDRWMRRILRSPSTL